jgi:type IV pilus assembly protein PilA
MTAQKLNNKSIVRGFTLIELLVVIGILAILLAITLIAINPARQFGLANDTKRRSDISEVLNAVGQYAADPANSGNLPTALNTVTASTPAELNSTNFGTSSPVYGDLCDALVTTYISALPVDPSITTNAAPNGNSGISQCSGTWDTGYQIEKDASNRITILAPDSYSQANGGAEISVTR